MTPRERILNAISLKPVDRLPFCTYNCHPFTGSPHVSDPAYAPVLDAIRHTSTGCLCKTSTRRLAESFQSARKWTEGSDTFRETILKTPLGALTRIDRTPEDQPSLCIKAFIETDHDIEKYFSIPSISAQYDVSTAVSMAREIGDKGLPYLPYGDPFYHIASLFHPEDLAIRTITEFDKLREMVDKAYIQVRSDLVALLSALDPHDDPFLFFTVGPELATPPLLSPDIFRDLVVPHQSELVALIHESGHRVSLHCHGRVREIFPYALQCCFDVIEPLEPPPQGNISLPDLLTSAGDSIALMGYVQDQDFYMRAESDIQSHMESIAALTKGLTGYICCQTCTPFQYPPSEAYVQNYVAFLQAAETYGLN